MAKHYNTNTHDIYYTCEDLWGALEDEYFELDEFLALKKLDGHDVHDQWYMLVHRKMAELLDVMNQEPINTLDPDIKPLF